MTIALASIVVAIYAGYVGSPWWGALICSTTLIVVLATTHVRLQRKFAASGSLKMMIFDLGPYCFAAGFGAYAVGHLAHVLSVG